MKEIEKKIKEASNKVKEVGLYFEDKIAKGEFEFKGLDEHTATILVDGIFEIKLWIWGGEGKYFDFYESNVFPHNERMLHHTYSDKNRIAGWKQISKYIREAAKEKKRKLIEELENLENE